jgi:hypothetical protein
MTYAFLISLALGAVAFAVQSVRLGNATTQLATKAALAEATARQLVATNELLDQAKATIASQTSTYEAELAGIKAQLADAESFLAKSNDPAAVGSFARSVLTGQADTGPGTFSDAPALPHGSAPA